MKQKKPDTVMNDSKIVTIHSNHLFWTDKATLPTVIPKGITYPVAGKICGDHGFVFNEIRGHKLINVGFEKWFCFSCGWIPDVNATKALEAMFVSLGYDLKNGEILH